MENPCSGQTTRMNYRTIFYQFIKGIMHPYSDIMFELGQAGEIRNIVTLSQAVIITVWSGMTLPSLFGNNSRISDMGKNRDILSKFQVDKLTTWTKRGLSPFERRTCVLVRSNDNIYHLVKWHNVPLGQWEISIVWLSGHNVRLIQGGGHVCHTNSGKIPEFQKRQRIRTLSPKSLAAVKENQAAIISAWNRKDN